MKKLFAVAAVVALSTCSSSTPCVDAECTAIAGFYRATWDLDGGSLERTGGDGGTCAWVVISEWELTQTTSTIGLKADLIDMSGSLYTNGSLSLTGEANGLSASLTAQVTPGSNDPDAGVFAPVELRGQLVSTTFDAEGNSCYSVVNFEATQR